MVKLYAHGNRDTGLNYSPFVWRAILALKHKKVDFDIEILRFREVGPKISELTDGKWKLVPLVQFDDGSIVYDSLNIASELDKRYPGSPKLYPNGMSTAKFHEANLMLNFLPAFKRLLMALLKPFDKEDQDFFREKREVVFGCTLEEFVQDADDQVKTIDANSNPLRAALKVSPYLEGDEPSFSDYIYCSQIQTMRMVKPDDFDLFVVNHQDKTLLEWYERIDKYLEGYLKSAKTVKDV